MMYPVVVQVVPTEDFFVYIYFEDGKITMYDMKSSIAEAGIFEKLNDKDFFMKATVMNGTLSWDDHFNCIDIDPFVLYERPRVKDPLEKEE